MSHSKIVIGITGSIAAYKSCELISQLIKEGHEVKAIMTSTAQKFLGKASVEALTKNKVYVDDFSDDSLMSHIELGNWCDAALIYPASAQTINSFANGVGHELINSFFLAFDFSKNFLIAPAMNTRMFEHPVTKKSLKQLKKIGCQILDTEEGPLACGEYGLGRLLNPERTKTQLLNIIGNPKPSPKRILITAGGTRETIDGVRTLTNMSTGKTGAALADHLHEKGYQVLLLTNQYSIMPKTDVRVDTYDSFRDIYNTLKALSQSHNFDMILHAAAISDYSISNIQTPEGLINPSQDKMSSQYDNISIQLKRNEKILPRLKDLFGSKTQIVGFKLTSTESKEEQARAIFSLFTENAVDYVIHNDMNDINKGQRKYLMTSKMGHQKELESTESLAEYITTRIEPDTLEAQNDLMS